MGYYTSYNGKITITPPIPYVKAKDSPFLFDNSSSSRDRSRDRDVMFDLDVRIIEVDEGILTVRQAVALVPIMEGRYKGYDIVEHVQEAIDAYPEHEFTGRLDCQGEDGFVWRLEIHDRKAVKVTPRIVWPLPDGGEEIEAPRGS